MRTLGRGFLVWFFVAASAVPAAPDPPPKALFTEVPSSESGLDFVHFNGMTGDLYLAEINGSGVGLLDYDGDGDLDVYLVQQAMLDLSRPVSDALIPHAHDGPVRDRLYRNDLTVDAQGRAVARFVDVTERAGLDVRGFGMGVAVADYDGDGAVDLYIANLGSNVLLRNRGDGTFEDVTDAAGADDPRWSASPLFFDFDRDGWLDLYVGNYVEFRLATHKPCYSPTGALDYCGPQAFDSEPDRLLRNLGNGTFEDVSVSSGLAARAGAGLGAVSADFNGDGWLDLYVANDQEPNFLWLNQGDGTFVEDALISGCAVNQAGMPEASMGIVVADFDENGAEDLFLTHLDRESNTLYLNDGTGFFTDASLVSGLALPSIKYTGFGVSRLDYDSDGREDLFVANGAVKRIERLMARDDPHPLHQPNQLFRSLGGGSFEEIIDFVAGGSTSRVSRGLGTGDLDQDGDADLVISNNAGPAEILRNEIGQDAGWIGLARAESGEMLAHAGGRVRVVAGTVRPRVRRFATDGSYASASDPRIQVGLGRDEGPVEVLVEHPSGLRSRHHRLPGRRYVTFVSPRAQE